MGTTLYAATEGSQGGIWLLKQIQDIFYTSKVSGTDYC